MYQNQYGNMGGRGPLGGQMTPLVKRILTVLIALYIVQVFALKPDNLQPGDNPLSPRGLTWLYLWDLNSGHWRPWQPVTAFLFNAGVFSAALDWLMVFFFVGPVQQLIGKKRLLKALLWSWATAVIFTHAVMLLNGVTSGSEAAFTSTGFRGLEPFLMSLLVIFGLAQPNAQILLFFVLPIKAAWVAWVSGLLALLVFLTEATLGTSLVLGGWLGGYLYVRSGFGNIQRFWVRLKLLRKKKKIEKELAKFTVIDGGKDDDTDYLH